MKIVWLVFPLETILSWFHSILDISISCLDIKLFMSRYCSYMLSRHEYLNTVYRQAKCCRVGPGGCGYRSLNVTTSAAAAAAAIKGAPAPDRHFVPWKTSTGNQWQQHQHAHPNHRERISDAIEVIWVTTINQFIFNFNAYVSNISL